MIANFTEKGTHYHIEFAEQGLFLPISQDAFDDDNDYEDLQGEESQVANHVDKYVVRILENAVVNEIYQGGTGYKDSRQYDESTMALNHYDTYLMTAEGTSGLKTNNIIST